MYTQLFSSAELSVPHSEIHSELSRTEWLSVSAPIHSTQDWILEREDIRSGSVPDLELSRISADNTEIPIFTNWQKFCPQIERV